jgi:primosomal protein N' (replication factor Y)
MLAAVALPVALHRTYTYAVPESLAARVVPGARVVVPLGPRKVVGIVTDVGVDAPAGARLRALHDAPDPLPALSPALLELGTWIARHYATAPGIVLRAMLPAALTGAAHPEPPVKLQRVVRLGAPIESLMERDRLFRRAPKQRAVLELLEALGGTAPAVRLLAEAGADNGALAALVKRGLVVVEQASVMRDPFASRAVPRPARHVATPAQREAIAALQALPPGGAALLHGITGSGKTLVYIEFLRALVEQGRGAIVLVPEIALTPQTVDRFRAAFGERVAVLHSALSDGERYDAWASIRRGERPIVVGARSAVFAPVARLAAIVVDEEHEASYKQGEAPRYHARDVARMRAHIEGAACVLGSATPSLESWLQARQGTLALLSLPERAGGAQLPAVHVVDRRRWAIRPRRPDAGAAPGSPMPPVPQEAIPVGEHLDPSMMPFGSAITPPLEKAIDARLARGEQILLLLNRRGYAAFLQCEQGHVKQCPDCAIALTYHRVPERLACHYCDHREPPTRACVECGMPTLRERGLGTQQLERLLGERWPAARIARMDLDTTGGKWAHSEILDRVGRHEVDILLGTQMIAKGLDFPNVTLVGVVDADVGINLPDFRASERCFQLLAQVAGRAGRGAKGGEVFIQTREPGHHAVTCAVTHDYLRFAELELAGRSGPTYPPLVHAANVIVSGTDEQVVAEAARQLADWTRRLIAAKTGGAVDVLGAAPSPIERIKTRWRWHFLLKSEDAKALGRVGRYLVEHGPLPRAAELRLAYDRDPVTLM